ncbi:Clp protease N-terminal domain-containing protein [Dactylosporangium sp. NPDC049140]|jgi:ATP-dependent Clp protease ATP-binding subunit ClpC|uniref:Clp protease N-terminal domain-containing protein n=1 Tax=Dactylosporangium sp. NPDC049140 TaxID=3155647 RepID=UPI0033C0C61B
MEIEVTLPDHLATALDRIGLPVSALCERALEQALRRAETLRALPEADLPHYTERAKTALRLAYEHATTTVTTADLLHGLLEEGTNLAVRLLPVLGADPATLTAPPTTENTGPAAAALELAHSEATALGHNYIGAEHILLGLLAEPSGVAGATLRARGLTLDTARTAVVAALAGFTHARG